MRDHADLPALDPAKAEPHYFAGIINQRWSRHEQAYESYITSSTNDPENVQYLLAAAESLIALGRYAEARDVVHSRLEYHEHNASLRHLLGHIAKLERRPAEAASLLHQAMLLMPDDPQLLESRRTGVNPCGNGFIRCRSVRGHAPVGSPYKTRDHRTDPA